MFCDNCGKELNGNEAFCPACGHKINKSNLDLYFEKEQPEVKPQVSKKPLVFAIIGFIFSLSNIIELLSLFSLKDDYSVEDYNTLYPTLVIILFGFCIVSLIFSIMGLKSTKRGLGIAGIIISIAFMLVYLFLLIYFFAS